jgi:GTP pyrophosphokinase
VAGVHYRAEIRVIGNDRVGLLGDISNIRANERISVKSMSARTYHGDAILLFGLEISSREQLDNLCVKLKHVRGMHEIERVI